MNEIINKFLLIKDGFMPERKKYKNLKKHSRHICQNEDKACFQQDMACGDFKDLPKRTTLHEA